MENFLFYFFSAAMLAFAVATICTRNPVGSAIFLVLVFFFMAALFVLLNAFFLAAVQVLVYAGAIMVLFLFVIMMLNVSEEERRSLHWFGMVGALVIIPSLIAEVLVIGSRSGFDNKLPQGSLEGTTESVGRLLFSKYLLPFEVSSVLLLVAMIGVIVLSKKEKAS